MASQTCRPEKIVVVFTGKPVHITDMGIPLVTTSCNSADARNSGAALCDSDYLAFLDDDDEWFPDKLDSQIRCAGSGASIVSSPYVMKSREGIESYFTPSKEPARDILGENTVGCTSMPLVRRGTFLSVGGFDPRMASNQEWDLWIRILQNGQASVADVSAGIKHFSEESISENSWKREKGWVRILMKHLPDYLRNPHQMERALWFFYREMRTRKRVFGACIGAMAYGSLHISHLILDSIRRIDAGRSS